MVTDRPDSVTASIPSRPPQHCDMCGTALDRDTATVTYRVDEEGKAFSFRLLCGDVACQSHHSCIGPFLSQHSMSVNEFTDADKRGVWNARIRRDSVRDANAMKLFLLRLRVWYS